MNDVSPLQHLDRDGLIALAPHFAQLVQRAGTIGGSFVQAEVLKSYQAHGLSLSLNHYYSPIPDVDQLPESLWKGPAFMAAWRRVNVLDYRPLLRNVLQYSSELKGIPREATGGFCWENPMFPPLDAIVYYGLVRDRRPRRILEIGSGYSTQLAAKAVAANGCGTITCIEPYPTPVLLALEKHGVTVIRARVQDLPDSAFSELAAGDFLFIDTSHAIKAGSDVNDILFRVLASIKRGVLVHIHDMFLPYEYPRHWYHDIGIIWNEQYAVLALLMDSERMQVVLPNYLASMENEPELTEALKDFDIWSLTQNLGGARGASLWVEVTRD